MEVTADDPNIPNSQRNKRRNVGSIDMNENPTMLDKLAWPTPGKRTDVASIRPYQGFLSPLTLRPTVGN